MIETWRKEEKTSERESERERERERENERISNVHDNMLTVRANRGKLREADKRQGCARLSQLIPIHHKKVKRYGNSAYAITHLRFAAIV